MTFVNKPFALACVAVAAVTLCASAQTSQLNPTVKVLSRPQSPVSPECATGIDTTAPALEPEPQPAPSREAIPPSNSLRASLRRVQVAAEGDDYAAFKAALAEARRAAASHPAGGERNAANDAIQVYTDIARVWDYAMTSPSGSFFDGTVQGGSLLSALKRYPDYGKTIASETIVAGDRTLYPSRETRHFLARESSRRLAKLGVSVPAKMAGPKPEWPRIVPPGTAGVPPASTSTHKAKTGGRPVVSTKAPTTKHKAKAVETTVVPEKPVVSTRAPSPKHKTKAGGTPAVPGKPVVAAKAPSTASTSTHEAKSPATTTSSPAPTATSETTAGGTPALPGTSVVSTQPPSTTSATTTTTAPVTDTTATVAPDTATTATTAPAEKQGGNTNIIWAIVLILVGIGVLVVLFRASD